MQTYTPKQAAHALNVAVVTIYKWVDQGRIECIRIPAGFKPRIEIPQSAIDLMQSQLSGGGRNVEGYKPATVDESAWVNQFRGLFGTTPPCFLAWKRGKVTFTEMKNETERRMRSMME
jgi:excisionase family DNA binding protein